MRAERYQNAIAVLLIVLVFASVPLLLNLPGLWWLWAPVLASLAVLPAVFLREVDVPVGGRSPVEVRDALAAELGSAWVTPAAPNEAGRARLNGFAAVRFRTRVTEGGTVLTYQPWVTRAGGAFLVAFVLSIIGSTVALAATLAVARQTSKSVKSVKVSVTRRLQEVGPAGTGDDVHALLISSLSTSLRTARDAYEAQRKSYTDSQLVAVIAAFTVWIALLIVLFVALNGFNLLTGRWEVPIAGATLSGFALGILFLTVIRRQFRPRLARYLDWTGRLADAMGREMARTPTESAWPNTFELLLRASEQVPDWLDAQRRAGLSADPKTAFVILLLVAWTGTFLINGMIQVLSGAGVVSVGSAYLAIAAILVAVAAWIYRRWKRGEVARLQQSRAAWDGHLKALHARMDRFLEEM